MNRVKFGAHDALEDWGIYLVSAPSLRRRRFGQSIWSLPA